jgi:uncharacterized protein YdeI (YjbR/CyaY-like superfamily)
MEITTTLYITNREAWRNWLMEHSKTEKEIWLIYTRKHTGQPRIPYNDAVEEALCFGWIDSTAKKLDEERFVQKFSPRRARSAYSQANKERLRRMIEQGKVMDDVLMTLGDILDEEFKIPPDILEILKANDQAWENFQRYSGSYQRIRIAFIDGTRDRPEEYKKRLKHFIEMTEKDKKFGFGIETYY